MLIRNDRWNRWNLCILELFMEKMKKIWIHVWLCVSLLSLKFILICPCLCCGRRSGCSSTFRCLFTTCYETSSPTAAAVLSEGNPRRSVSRIFFSFSECWGDGGMTASQCRRLLSDIFCLPGKFPSSQAANLLRGCFYVLACQQKPEGGSWNPPVRMEQRVFSRV